MLTVFSVIVPHVTDVIPIVLRKARMPTRPFSVRPLHLTAACFVIGIVGILVVLALYALGERAIPVWLTMGSVGCASVGFAAGLVLLLREARSG